MSSERRAMNRFMSAMMWIRGSLNFRFRPVEARGAAGEIAVQRLPNAAEE